MKTSGAKRAGAKPAAPVAGPGARRRGGQAALRLERILVPLDFSGKSRQALEFAVPLAERYGGKVFLVHVVPLPVVSTWEVVPGGQHYLAMDMSQAMEAARQELAALADSRVPVALRGRTLVRQGSAYSEITEAAREIKADLIVISTHGYTGMRRMLIGSVAERVVRHAPCAVLAVRRH